MKRRRAEQDLQRAVVGYLTAARPRCLWFHVPNGGARSAAEAAIFSGLGVLPGVADLVFLGASGAPVERACIELKAGRGKLSPRQLAFQARCQELGIPYAVCRSFDEVHRLMIEWGFVAACRVVVQ